MSLQFHSYEDSPRLYGAAPLVLVLSDDAQVHQTLSETLNRHGFEVRCAQPVQFQSMLEQLERRPRVLVVDALIELNVLQTLAEILESHHQLRGCARVVLGDEKTATDIPIPFQHLLRFPCERAEILALMTHIGQRSESATSLSLEEVLMIKTILIVEDDPNQGLLYEEELSDEGYRVLRATNGREALEIVKVRHVDCVVLDINMPVMDGLDAMGRMLEHKPQLPVVINTAFSAYKDSFTSWAADAYVMKSSDLTELKVRIKEALARTEQAKRERGSRRDRF